jgi:hypothetical protein
VLQYGHRDESSSSSASDSDSDEDVFSRSAAAACDIGMYFFAVLCGRDAFRLAGTKSWEERVRVNPCRSDVGQASTWIIRMHRCGFTTLYRLYRFGG